MIDDNGRFVKKKLEILSIGDYNNKIYWVILQKLTKCMNSSTELDSKSVLCRNTFPLSPGVNHNPFSRT